MGTVWFPVNGFFMNQLVSIGERLREERVRIGLNQTAFGEAGGVTKKSQMLYEGGERAPDATYLAAVGAAGADVRYILTGQREGPPQVCLSAEEQTLLSYFRAASSEVRRAAIGALVGATSTNFEGSQQVFLKAPRGDIAGRDIVKGGGKR